MNFTEISSTSATSASDNLYSTLQMIKSGGVSTSAGKTSDNLINAVYTAQFPASRSSGNDSTLNTSSTTDLYTNGLQFKAYHFESRTTTDLAGQRTQQQNTSDLISAVKSAIGRDSTTGSSKGSVETNLVCNILMPRSKSDVDAVSHKFNDVNDSLMTKGGGSVTGALSNMASTAVFGGLESVSQGMFADKGEQLFNSSRAMYAGADNRTKVFTWDLIPRTVDDLRQIVSIYEYFTYFSYGVTGSSNYSKAIQRDLVDRYKNSFLKPITPDGADLDNTAVEKITSFLSNAIVVSNPTIWMVRNFGDGGSADAREDIFGPCQIQSVRLDKSPEGQFTPLQIAPNLPSSFQLEIQMREIIQLNRRTFKAGNLL